jgi:diguanylate cyclase (GGDEF)-like protein
VTAHLLLLLAEATLVASLVLALFGLRRRLGLTPVYLVVGAFQYLQIVLATAVRVEMLPGVVVDPASVVLFPITTFVVLLTYIELDASETRKVAYGVVISNLAAYGVSALAGWHLVVAGHENPMALPPALFTQSLRLALASTAALFVDVVSALVVFEAVSGRVQSLFLRLWLTAAAVMAIDSVLFTLGLRLGQPGFVPTLLWGFAAKLAGATFYAACVALYLRYVDEEGVEAIGERKSRDVFQWLTYRQRYEEVRSQMARDALTGLFNRGYFDEQAPRLLAHAQRANHVMSLVIFDVDHLKATNDHHGHLAGDQLLRFVADQLQGMVRASDAACRYGGDEFVVLLTTADAAAARIFAERLIDLLGARSRALIPPPPWAPARVTAGIATYPADGRTVDEMLHVADARLYHGKRLGGGRAISDTPGV